MTIKKLLEECYSIDVEKTHFAFTDDTMDSASVVRSMSENELVLESASDEYSRLMIDDIDVDDMSNKTRLFII